MKLTISSEVARRYPDLRIGIAVARDIDNTGESAALEDIRRNKTADVRQHLSLDTLGDHPHIRAWREAYRSFGANPKRHPPTAEALIRRLLTGKDLPPISKAVDLYIAAEIEFVIPVGGYDLSCVTGDIQLRASPGGEPFLPLGAEPGKPEYTKPGEIVYSDSVRVLTRMWNYRDSDFAKITDQSKNIALFAEAPSPEIPTIQLQGLLDAIASRLTIYCGGSTRTQVASVENSLQFDL